MHKRLVRFSEIAIIGLVLTGASACSPNREPIAITATFEPPSIMRTPPPSATTVIPTVMLTDPTPDSPRTAADEGEMTYTVQPGDTLGAIALANGISLEQLVQLNNITDANMLSVGQLLQLPAPPNEFTPAVKLMSNSRFVRTASALSFNTEAFIATQPGTIRTLTDTVGQSQPSGFRVEETLTSAQIVDRVSREFSVDPRLLLALLEYRGGWLTRNDQTEIWQQFPFGEADENREGLYRQLSWAADRMNAAYYGWRYDDLSIIAFESGERLLYEPSLNGGTVALQAFLAFNQSYSQWQASVDVGGFLTTYNMLFGDPFADDTPTVPADLIQPALQLPFAQDETWFYTGGPHGGWGNGSAWAAVDLAPPDNRQPGDAACYTSAFPVRAVADGVISRSDEGSLMLDIDNDGYEETGWTILYLHVTSDIRTGQSVRAGDPLGFTSCEGGFSNATHLHIARRYNGEWLPSDCQSCPVGRTVPPFTMGGWTVYGIPNQVYQGTMVRNGITMRAEQGRLVTYNRIAW